jgi:hypothetical protein
MMATMGVVLVYTAKIRRRNRSLLARTRKQAGILAEQAKRRAEKLADAAADSLAGAVEAGKAAYQRVAG